MRVVPRAPGPLRPTTGWRCRPAPPQFGGARWWAYWLVSTLVFGFLWGFRGPAGSFRGCLVAASSALLGLEAAGAVAVEGGWGRALCSPVEPCSHGLEALRSAAGGSISRWLTWPWLQQQPVPPVPAESLPHRVSTGGTHCLHQWQAGTGVAEGHGPLPLFHTRRSAPESLPLATVSAPHAAPLRARGSPGDKRRRCPVRPRGRRCGDGPAGGSGGERSKPNNEKSPPALGSAAPTKALVPWSGENPSQGAKQRCPSPPSPAASSGRRTRGRGAEPGGDLRPAEASPPCCDPAERRPSSGEVSAAVWGWFPLPTRSFPSPLCVPPPGGSGLVRDHKSCGPFGPGLWIYPRRVLNKQLFVL